MNFKEQINKVKPYGKDVSVVLDDGTDHIETTLDINKAKFIHNYLSEHNYGKEIHYTKSTN